MSAPTVLIGIVSYRSGKMLRQCLESIRALPDRTETAVCLVDNYPESGDGRAAQAAFPDIRLIESAENDGYGAGMNRAFASGESEYFLILNPDTEIEPGAIDTLVSVLRSAPALGIAAPRLSYPGGRPQPSAHRFYTWPLALLEATDLNLRFPGNSLLRDHTYDGAIPLEPTEVDWVNGACLMIRSSLFEQLGGFDQRYFMYFEEVDLCRRVRQSGRGVAFVPDAGVVHSRAHSTTATDLRQVEFHKSLCRYLRKHHGLPADLALRAVLFLWRSLYLAAIALRYLPGGDIKGFTQRAASTFRLLAWVIGIVR
jgi:GT2 family glycosyltransferase